MNSIAEQIIAEGPSDPLWEKFKLRHDRIAKQALAWKNHKDSLIPVMRAFEVIGAHLTVDGDGDIGIGLAGDKETFVKAWKLLRSIGIRLSPVEKGSTSLTQFLTHDSGLRIMFNFSSTVCQRVKVGTKMQEVDVYETQCGTPIDLNIEALEPPAAPSGLLSTDDDIPF